MSARDDLVAAMEAHEKVGQVFDAAGFSADHPMFLDWARVGFALKKAVAHLDAEPVWGVQNDQGYWKGCWNDRAIAERMQAAGNPAHGEKVVALYARPEASDADKDD